MDLYNHVLSNLKTAKISPICTSAHNKQLQSKHIFLERERVFNHHFPSFTKIKIPIQ